MRPLPPCVFHDIRRTCLDERLPDFLIGARPAVLDVPLLHTGAGTDGDGLIDHIAVSAADGFNAAAGAEWRLALEGSARARTSRPPFR